MGRPILDKIKSLGRNGYLATFARRRATKADLLKELEDMAEELQMTERFRREGVEAIANLEEDLQGVKGDARRAEEVADDYIRRLETEKASHRGTKARAARVLHGAVTICTEADPNLADMPRGGVVHGGARRMVGEVGPEAIVPPGRRKSDFDWPA